MTNRDCLLFRDSFLVLLLGLIAVTARADPPHETDDTFWADAAALLPGFDGVPAPPGNSGAAGVWSGIIAWPHIPVSAASLPNGKILTFSGQERTFWPRTKRQTYWTIYDPGTGRFDENLYLDHEMFCSHLVMRADGMLQTAGGRYTVERSSVFDFRSNVWRRVGDMHDPRWYPTSVALPDGDVFTVGGRGGPHTAERFSVADRVWNRLNGINWQPVSGADGFESEWWPYLFVAPSGQLFHFGPTETMHWVSPEGNGSRISTGLRVPNEHYPKHAGITMYASGKILIAGGASGVNGGSTSLCYTVDLNTDPPSVKEVAPMKYARRFSNAVVLPTGEVLIAGGTTMGHKFSDVGTVLTPEVWNPASGTWREVADMAVPRNYHSVGILLADGRVFLGGGGYSSHVEDHPANHQDAQIFTPPALFRGNGQPAQRPVLSQVPGNVTCGSTFLVEASGGMAKFAAIRLIATTHGLSTDQRYLNLPFAEESAGRYRLVAHPNPNVMMPGYWMLFGIDADGVYSEAQIFRVMQTGRGALSGLRATYFDGLDLTAKRFERIDPQIDFDFEHGGPDAALLGDDGYSVRWEGWIVPEVSGQYTFFTEANDGVRLWVADRQLIDQWASPISFEASGEIHLSAGDPVRVRMDYFEESSAAQARLLWSGPGISRQVVPERNLRHVEPQGEAMVAADGDFELFIDGRLVAIGTESNRAYHASFAAHEETTMAFRVRRGGENAVVGSFLIDGEPFVTSGQWRVSSEAVDGWNMPGFDDSAWARATELGSDTDGVIGMPVYESARRLGMAGAGHAGELFFRFSTRDAEPDDPILPNAPPQLAAMADQAHPVEAVVALRVEAVDADGDPLTYAVTGLPESLEMDPATGLIHGTVVRPGVHEVTVSVSDRSITVSQSFTWTVNPPLRMAPITSRPLVVGQSASFSGQTFGGTRPRYRWNFGDDGGDSAWSSSPQTRHRFEQPGRYFVRFMATDDTGVELEASFVQNVAPVLLGDRPSVSQSVIYEKRAGNDRLWSVNPDNDSVSVIDVVSGTKLAEIGVEGEPRSLALQGSDSVVWVVNKRGSSISRIRTSDWQFLPPIALPRGSAPHGLVFDAAGTYGYVALEGLGEVAQIDGPTGRERARIDVGANPRHLSITGDGAELFVSTFITPRLPGEHTAAPSVLASPAMVRVLGTSPLSLKKKISLRVSEVPDSGGGGRGLPNYLGPACLSPAGDMAWVPSKQDNVLRGKLRDGRDLTYESSVRAVTSRIDLHSAAEDGGSRIDHDDAAVPSTALFGPNGLYVFVALQGSREVAVIDAYGERELFRFDVGRAPQGLAMSPQGRTLFVHNFMDRTVSVHDVSPVVDHGLQEVVEGPVYSLVAEENLAPQVLLGKQLFYDARDRRLSRESYLSCASCHSEGGHDGRVWDLTGFGEGLRNTIDLRGRGGTAHGPLHWSANFDEVQDFEGQIRQLAFGRGLLPAGEPHLPLEAFNAGRSVELDALAAYVGSLDDTLLSPYRLAGGGLTSEALAGRELFRLKKCGECHAGSRFTDSAPGVLHDIGTIKPHSGRRLGRILTGIDTPTLRGLWNGAPYLHDGSAATIAEAIAAHEDVVLTSSERHALAAYLMQVDDFEYGAPSSEALLGVEVPASLRAAETASVLVDYRVEERRHLGVWLLDLLAGRRVVAHGLTVVDPGLGREGFTLGLGGELRPGDGYAWVVRLLPEGWDGEESTVLAEYETDASIVRADPPVMNFASLPEASAAQSSVLAEAFGADLARDGNRDGDWRHGSVSHTHREAQGWWEVDLGEVREISHLLIWNRTDSGASRLESAYVFVSAIPFDSHELERTRQQLGVSAYLVAEAPMPVRRLEVGRSGRFVRIQRTGSGYLNLAEVEVYGVGESSGDGGTAPPGLYGVYGGDDNGDGDLLDAVAEYALSSDPGSGAMHETGLRLMRSADGRRVDLSYRRPAQLEDVGYTLELSADYREWVVVEGGNTQVEADGRWERVRYEEIDRHLPSGTERGFVRLRMRQHAWARETTSPVYGWYRTTFDEGFQTHGLSLNRDAVFASRVAGVVGEAVVATSGGLLAAVGSSNDERAHYLEFTGGALEGHRIELRESQSNDEVVALDTLAGRSTLRPLPMEGVVGAPFVVRAHRTLGEAYPIDLFRGGHDSDTSDRVLFLVNGRYDRYFPLKRNGSGYWTSVADAVLKPATDLVIPPGVGCFVQRPQGAGPLSLLVTGQVRTTGFVQRYDEGYQLVASPHAFDTSPAGRGLTVERGFTGSADPVLADQIQLWRGDAQPGDERYQTYFLLDGGGAEWRYWTGIDDVRLRNENDRDLFSLDRAFIWRGVEAREGYAAFGFGP